MGKVISLCVWGDHDPELHAKNGYVPMGVYNLLDDHQQFFTVYFPLDFCKKVGVSRLADFIGQTITKELLLVLPSVLSSGKVHLN